MDLWFTETFGDIQGGWRVKQALYHRRSKFQDIAVLDTHQFGRMLVLDGCVMTTEKDECAYHEMLTHPGLLAHPHPKEICVVGGGDGGTVREVLRHRTVEHVVLAEIDEDVVAVCREFMPSLAGALDDPRVEIRIGDGAQFLAESTQRFDAILSDSTDPVGPGVVLFEDAYFRSAKQALRAGGFFVTQCKSLWLDAETARQVAAGLSLHYSKVLPYVSAIPTYPSGFWSFLFASDQVNPLGNVDARRQREIEQDSRYYTTELQTAAFAVPRFYYTG
jgi:spermidine synthase